MTKKARKSKDRHHELRVEKNKPAGSPIEPSGRAFLKKPLIHVLLLIFVGTLVYSNTFSVPFQFDDAGMIETPFLKNLTHSEQAVVSSNRMKDVFSQRYFGSLSFELNRRISGAEPAGYHAVNLLIHIANAILVYLLAAATFSVPLLEASRLREHAGYIALFSALFFISHPIQTQAVTYIVQRLASLTTLFYLLSLLSYVKYRLSSGGTGRYVYYSAAFLSAALAMFTKEIAFTLPMVIMLYELMFFRGAIGKRMLFLLPILATMLIVPLLMVDIKQPSGNMLEKIGEATRVQTSLSRWDYLFTEIRVIVTYLRLLVIPVNQNLDYDYPVYRSLFETQVFLSFLLLSVLIGAAVCMLRRANRSDQGLRLSAFGIFWFFITLSVESGIIPIADVIFEHRVYLPSVGAFAAFTSGIFFVLGRVGRRGIRQAVISIIIISQMIYAGAAYSRNAVWSSDVSLWEDVVKKSPQKARGRINLGNAYKTRGMIDDAIREFDATVRLRPDSVKAHYNLGVALWTKGLVDKAVESYKEALRLNPDYAEAHNNLGVAFKTKGLMTRAEEHYLSALKLNPDYAEAHNNIGEIYGSRGLTDRALEHYKEALRLEPDFAEAHNNLGTVLRSKGMVDKAVQQYETALRLKPDFVEAHYNLGYIYYEKRMMEKARREFETVLRLRPGLHYARQMLNAIAGSAK